MHSPLHILLVDDQPEIGEILSLALEADGHSTVCCRSGVEGYQRIQHSRRRFDLLITDHYMPGSLNGLDLVRIARAKGYDRQIVVTSGALTPELQEAYEPFLILGYLPKPIDLQLVRTFAQRTSLAPKPGRHEYAVARA